ncbi:hypothetical protein ACFO1B_40990 [Dactylosporangium siamense]|uniref:PKD domain-containing protein n=1 Tax=Dactylosporangium siamense TaxID=685454 RepID=A0A919PFI0_9ACTN|nr:hypothetical protein [Dactylosporangium siamense]GIG42634.1 hypothetical protein Dsi01nite_006750 [Dactylosporangium siamense]
MPSLRSLTSSAVALVAVAGGLLVATAGPAGAATTVQIPSVRAAYTDAFQPLTSHVDDQLGQPVGLWRDGTGQYHLSRAYYTFDLSAYAGLSVTSAAVRIPEFFVADCARASGVALYRAAPFTAPTWSRPPARQALLDATAEDAAGCPGAERWDVTAELTAALAEHRPALTVELRLTGLRELDPGNHRLFTPTAAIDLTYNRPPSTPVPLVVDTSVCGSGTPILSTNATPFVSAYATDPDDDPITTTLAVWPQSDPARRTEFPGPFGTVPAGVLTDDGTYLLSARAVDPSGAASEWAVPCAWYFDSHPPANAPTVTATGGQPGRVGAATSFTFSANGDADVVGFRWGFDAVSGPVLPADAPGGSATVQWTPAAPGTQHLVVVGVDRVGNTSPAATLDYQVASDAPTIEDLDPDAPFNQNRTIVFHPVAANVVDYVYKFKNNVEHVVPAGPDGTASVVLLVNKSGGGSDLTVYSRSADGSRSASGSALFNPRSAPTVSSQQYPIGGPVGAPAGTPGVFVVTSAVPGVLSYTYRIDGGPKVVAPTDADGNLVITYTPATSGSHVITIGFGVMADNITVDGGPYTFIAG